MNSKLLKTIIIIFVICILVKEFMFLCTKLLETNTLMLFVKQDSNNGETSLKKVNQTLLSVTHIKSSKIGLKTNQKIFHSSKLKTNLKLYNKLPLSLTLFFRKPMNVYFPLLLTLTIQIMSRLTIQIFKLQQNQQATKK